MFERRSKAWNRWMAFSIALAMFFSLFPVGPMQEILAVEVPAFTVELTDSITGDKINVTGAKVTITDTLDPSITLSEPSVNGTAIFTQPIEDEFTYTIEVSDVKGYKYFKEENVNIKDTISYKARLQEMDKVKVSGIIVDEADKACKDANVTLTGYTDSTIITLDDGKFQFEAYKGEGYSLVIVGAAKYKINNYNVDTSSDYDFGKITLEVKTFDIITNAGTGGTITGTCSVPYDSDKDIIVNSDIGYEIDKIIVDGISIDGVKGKETYTYRLEKVLKNRTVSASFVRKTYEISITYGENGKVYDGNGNEITGAVGTLGGTVKVEHGSSSAFRIKPSEHYHLSSLKVDDVVINLENDLNLAKGVGNEYVYTLGNVNGTHTINIEFSVDEFEFNVSFNNEMGTVSVSNTPPSPSYKVVYGNSIQLTIMPKDINHTIASITVDGNLVNVEDANLINNADGSSIFTLQSVSANHTINVTFKEVPVGNKEAEYYFSIETEQGMLRKPAFEENGSNVYIYSSNAKIKFTPKNEYKKINVKYSGKTSGYSGYKNDSGSFIESYDITEIFVEKTSGPDKGTVKVDVKPIKIVIDQERPTVDTITKSPLAEWTNQSVTVSGIVSDNGNSGIYKVRYSNNQEDVNNDTYEVMAATTAEANLTGGIYSFVISNSIEFSGKYYVWTYDLAGNKSSSTKEIFINVETTNPTIDEIMKSPAEDWTKNPVTISGKISDIGGSGIFEVRYGTSDTDFTNDSYTDSSARKAAINNGEYSFTITNSQEHHEIYYVWAYDKAGNKSSAYKSVSVNVDTTSPSVDSVTKSPSKDWTEGAVSITAKVSDKGSANNSGIASILYNTEDKVSSASKIETPAEMNGSDYTFTIDVPANEFKGQYFIWAVDAVGNVSEVKTMDVNIDTTNPIIVGFDIKTKNDSIPAKIINFLTFGTYFNQAVVVTVTADDKSISSGIDTITLFGDGVEIGTKTVDEKNQATFEISLPDGENVSFDKTLTASTTDKVERKSPETLATTVNSNIKNSKLMLENINPLVTITPSSPTYTDENGKNWYSSDLELSVSTSDDSDTNSGIYSVETNINGAPITADKSGTPVRNDYYKLDSKTRTLDFNFNTDQGTISEDGSYTLNVTTTDNAGNVYSDNKKVYKDTTNPVITGFTFAGSGNERVVQTIEYGFYFMKDTMITITSVDNGPASGVKSITYYTVDYSNNKNGVKSSETVVLVDKNNQISFVIPANFKGQIYAKATDNVNNTPVDFVKPDGTVIEDADKHAETSSIALLTPQSSYKDNEGLDLYEKDVQINIGVADSYSGIKTIEWSVVSEYDRGNNQSGIINIDNNRVVSGDIDGWVAADTDINLVTEMTKTMTVRNNSNNIKVHLKLTDRAGNSSEKEIIFSIDKTKPSITVSYDNNSYDEGMKNETQFFKANRTAKVVITERNFTAKDAVIRITNTDGVIPTVGSWIEERDREDSDKTTYTAAIEYTSDGDYTFDVSFSDLAHNAADAFATHSFTIDKTLPIISVAYDNNSAQNGNYYKAQRTATITINEHNFETSRIAVTGTATDNAKAVAYPVVSPWTSTGDAHTAKITFSTDALYSFDIAYTDKAGNKAEDFAEQKFYVDKTVPALEISGVQDKSANKGDVIPVVTLSDTNFNKNNVTITLTGAVRGTVTLNGAYSNITNGEVFAFNNFEKDSKNDDIYTLVATSTDMAGNKTEKSIMFSVNRFGSTYAFNNAVKEIQGKYVQKEVDLVITEVNVDNLKKDSIKIKVTKNGTPSDLSEGTDYTVAASGGQGQWSTYTYTVNSKVFEKDGKYIVTLNSQDNAGNVNENIDESKKAELWFGVDKTKPVIVPINLEEKTTYAVESMKAKVSVSDNLVLSNVKIYVNDKETSFEANGEDYTFDLTSSNSSQKVKIVATDAAGNELPKEIASIYVTTNIFVRWYTNKPLFIGSIAGAAILAIAATAYVLFRKKGKQSGGVGESGENHGKPTDNNI